MLWLDLDDDLNEEEEEDVLMNRTSPLIPYLDEAFPLPKNVLGLRRSYSLRLGLGVRLASWYTVPERSLR